MLMLDGTLLATGINLLELETLLGKIGWSQAYFGKRLGVTPKTVGKWVKEGAPEYALAYLKLIVRMIG